MEQKIKIIQAYKASAGDIKDVIAPSGLQINSNYIKLGNKFAKTVFIFTYPRYLSTGWFSPIINMPELVDISFFMHPVDTALALRQLRKKTTNVEAQLNERSEKGLVRDPVLETAFRDLETLRDALQQAREKLFKTGVYITIYADSLEDLSKLEGHLSSLLESRLVYVKPAFFQQMEGFASVLPLGTDKLGIHTPLNSGPVSSFFPFTSPNLTTDNGILYGVNLGNNSLVIFDRFSLENANTVVFAKSGSGKSYTTKLEIIRNLMMGVNVIVVDPEKEYKNLSQAVGGSFFNISLTSEHHINPFDIPIIPKDEDPTDVLKSHILNLTGLLKVMLGKITPEEEAIIDRAISETYASHDIVPGKDFSQAKPPLLEDLQVVIQNMKGGAGLADRLDKFIHGSYAGFTNNTTNIDIKNRFIVFAIRDLEDELRPIAMYIILNFIWNMIRADFKKRALIVDEAWVMMKNDDSASFLFGLVKRARKYFLGVTNITQEVDDFLRTPYGRPIITNSALQILLKQAPAVIDGLAKTFNLTTAEKNFLLEANVGEGLFFAGLRHAAIKVIASYTEDQIVTTNPEQMLEMGKTI
ncbi:MAG: ATP-binding protein [Candidatus Brennerbacteria bacterium]|nr:ATP-binding protein [Candidatus Brennerbacteria bacterium]